MSKLHLTLATLALCAFSASATPILVQAPCATFLLPYGHSRIELPFGELMSLPDAEVVDKISALPIEVDGKALSIRDLYKLPGAGMMALMIMKRPMDVRDHTFDVLSNHRARWSDTAANLDPSLENDLQITALMRMAVLLHDIGKGVAIIKEGHTETQHQYTSPIIAYILDAIEMSPAQKQFLKAFTAHDPIGDLLKGYDKTLNPTVTAQKIQKIAVEAGLSAREMFRLLEHFYFIDCAAYPFLKEMIFTSGPDGQMVVKPDQYPQYYQLKKLF